MQSSHRPWRPGPAPGQGALAGSRRPRIANRPLGRFALLAVLTFAACDLGAQTTGRGDREGGWPFGGGSGLARMRQGDYYNLGLLGAKAADADSQEEAAPRGGRRAVSPRGQAPKDDGPDRLKVRLLFPGGPAEKAGLLPGDVIVAVNGRSLARAPSLKTVADALVEAEGKTGKLVLRVERDGAPKPIDLTATIVRKAVPHALKPVDGKNRSAVLGDALAFLAKRQSSDGGFPQTLSGSNGAVVQAAMAGMAWLAGGSDLRTGPHRENIDKAVAFIIRYIDQPDPFGGVRGASQANWNQSNWSYVHAAIFLGELQARSASPRVKKELARIVQEICARQEESGGWAHGPGGKNALDYLELDIVTALALSGLGCAKAAGVDVPDGTVDKALRYIEASGPSGGVGYSDQPGQKGMGNIGRTAGCWLGLRLLGRGNAPYVQKMQSFVDRNIADVLGGHASLMQHILLAGLAAPAHGRKAHQAYWDAMERDLILARAPDGSLQPRPWHESLLMGSNSDVSFGEVWTTAAWAAVLGADAPDGRKGGLPTLLGKSGSQR